MTALESEESSTVRTEPEELASEEVSEEAVNSYTGEVSAHEHTWVAITETIHHEAEIEAYWVVDEAAWEEEVPVTEVIEKHLCRCTCGLLFESDEVWLEHAAPFWEGSLEEEAAHAGWTSVYVTEEVVIGTEVIYHDEIGHYETRVTKEAYDETVVTGEQCSECGAVR